MQKLEKILEEMKESSIMVATSKEHYIHPQDGRFVEEVVLLNNVEEIIRKHMSGKGKDAHMNDGWIPVGERLPEEPKENPVFDDKPLELYLVDMGGSYPLRAFWNGKEFTDGWSVLKVTAWMPMPEPYRPERSSDEKE